MPSTGDKVAKFSRRIRSWFGQLGRLRYPPWRYRVLVGMIIFPFILGGVLALTISPVAGIAGFSTAFSVPAFFRHDLRPGPRLSATVVTSSGHAAEAVLSPAELRILDREAIVGGSRRAAAETAPDVPAEPEPDYFGLQAFQRPTVQSMFKPTRGEVVAFLAEVQDYGAVLEDWLRRYEAIRAESARHFSLVFRLENDGEAPAQNVRLRVRCPTGFRHLTDPLPIQEAPSQPRFRTRFGRDMAVPLGSSGALREIGRRLTADPPVGPVPVVSDEQGQLVLTYEIGHLNHGPDHLRTDPVTLLAPETGDFELRWEALSANPGPAAAGVLKLRLEPAVEVEPRVTSMTEMIKDQKEHYIEEISDEA
jgi:hypothetical protein